MCPEAYKMFVKYFVVLIINANICWFHLVLPFEENYRVPKQNPEDLKDVGEPLILTPYLKSNQISGAQELSSVKSLLPGKEVISNAGFFTVDERYNSNLFFWFFRQESSDWQKAPLILWLQGGPGDSSMYGVFEENGPFRVTDGRLEEKSYSWTKDYNIIYIDQPIGSGFSFTNSSEGYINTQEKVADHLYEALIQFFQLYPELKKNAFYIAGESYAGRYIPAIGYRIHSLKKRNSTDINLKGLFMISAFTQGSFNGLTNYCTQIGIVDSTLEASLEKTEKQLQLFINHKQWSDASKQRSTLFKNISTISGVSKFDYTKTNKDFQNEFDFQYFLIKASTRKKIHVGKAEYFASNGRVNNDFHEDFSKSVVPWVEELVDHYSVAFVGGQFDVCVAYPLVVNVLKKLNWSGASYYENAERQIFGEENVDGYIKSAGNLKDVLIRNARHFVPRDQPRATLTLLNKFVNDEL